MLLGNQGGESAESFLIYWPFEKAMSNLTCCHYWNCLLVPLCLETQCWILPMDTKKNNLKKKNIHTIIFLTIQLLLICSCDSFPEFKVHAGKHLDKESSSIVLPTLSRNHVIHKVLWVGVTQSDNHIIALWQNGRNNEHFAISFFFSPSHSFYNHKRQEQYRTIMNIRTVVNNW